MCSVALISLSCAGTGGGSGAIDIPTLLVSVRAESKAGWVDPRKQSDYAGLRPGESRAYETIDYAQVDDVVVWVEPLGEQAGAFSSSGGSISIDLGSPQTNLRVAGRGAIWAFRNSTGRVIDIYLRTEEGKVVSLGAMPGPGRSVSPNVQGLVEVMAVDQPEPLARIYVAPTAFVRLASTKEPVRFFGVPPGRARIVAWHPRLPGATTEVNIAADRETRAAVTIGVNSLPKVP
jgi:hypothetical protein